MREEDTYRSFAFLTQLGVDTVEIQVCWFVYVSRLGMNKAGKFSWRQGDTLNRNAPWLYKFCTIFTVVTEEHSATIKFWTFTLFHVFPMFDINLQYIHTGIIIHQECLSYLGTSRDRS